MIFTRKEKMWIKVEKRIESERRYHLQYGDKPGGPELRGETEQEQKRFLWFSQHNGKKELLLESDTCSDFKYYE